MTQPPHNSAHYHAIIFGGGLAGTILAEQMLRAGHTALLVNDPSKSTCSRVAAGLVNPIGGKRLKLIWKADTLIPHAKTYYQQLGEKYGQKFFHPRTIRREFSNAQEAQLWQKRLADPAYQRWTGRSTSDQSDAHFTIPDAGYLDTNLLLDTLQSRLQSETSLLSSTFHYDEILPTPDGIRFRQFTSRFAIFAEGHLATSNPHFQFIPYKPAKGIIATITISSCGKRPCAAIPLDSHILIKSKFLIPRHDGSLQVGATYNWDDATDTPDEAGIQELKSFLDSQLGPDTWTFEQIKAGVRPATAGAYPVVGPHPTTPQLIAFNGFGSKGSLQIPYFAERLTSYLADTRANLPSETLPSRFIKKTAAKPKRWLATNAAKTEVLRYLKTGDFAIDATAGNGHDTLWLAETVGPTGHVFAFDIQEQALSTTRARLQKNQLSPAATLIHDGHENLLSAIPNEHHGKIAAIVFNLGFLPGGDPTLITRSDTTTRALKASLQLLKPDGILSITLYPSHSGAQEEVNLVLSWFQNLPAESFDTHTEPHPQGNPSSPYPIFVVKK